MLYLELVEIPVFDSTEAVTQVAGLHEFSVQSNSSRDMIVSVVRMAETPGQRTMYKVNCVYVTLPA